MQQKNASFLSSSKRSDDFLKTSTQRYREKNQGTENVELFRKVSIKNYLTQRRKAENQGAEKIPEAQALRLSFPFAPLR
jgi:hypothetical protein